MQMNSYQNPSIDRLLAAIGSLRTDEERASFFEDVCTIKELQDMAQRFEAAILLQDGASYQTISAKIGISTATISRVNRCLAYGRGGYRTAIARMQEVSSNDR